LADQLEAQQAERKKQKAIDDAKEAQLARDIQFLRQSSVGESQ
jgi:hypothetical protein